MRYILNVLEIGHLQAGFGNLGSIRAAVLCSLSIQDLRVSSSLTRAALMTSTSPGFS